MLSLPLPNPDDFKVDPKEMEALELNAMRVIDDARTMALTIDSVESCNKSADWIRGRKAWVNNIRTGFLGIMRDTAHQMHKQFVAKIDELCGPTETGIKIVNQAITEWNMGQERIRRQEQERLIAEAKKRDEDDRLAQAQAHEAAGNPTMAAAVLDGAGQYIAPIIPQEKPKGMSTRMYWEAVVTDKRQLLKFLAEKPGYENAVEINTTWLANQAKAMDGNLSVPGVTFRKRPGTTIR